MLKKNVLNVKEVIPSNTKKLAKLYGCILKLKFSKPYYEYPKIVQD